MIKKINKKTYLLIAAAVLVALIIISYLVSNSANYRVYGRVKSQSKDCRGFIGGAHCSWLVDDKNIEWSEGSAPGSNAELIGFDLDDDITGRMVEIMGHEIAPDKYEVSKDGEYIKLLVK